MKKDEKVEYIKAANPCPECGGKDHIRMMQMGAAWAVTCDDCGYTVGPFSLVRSAVKRWADDSKAAQERRAKEEEDRRAKEEEERKQKEGETKTLAVTIFDLPVEQLMNHPRNVRKTYTEIDDLAESIKSRGIMQNLTVVPAPGHKESADLFYVVIGNRRLQAAKKAGLKTLPCSIAWDMSEREQFSIMVTENMQRSDLTIEEQAESFQLMLDLGETVETIKEKTGLSESTVRHRLKLAELGVENIKKRRAKEGTQSGAQKYFQLGINDLIYLERVKSMTKRREILDTAADSGKLRYMVDDEARKERVAELKKKAGPILKALGVKYKDNARYDYEYKEVEGFDVTAEDDPLARLTRWVVPDQYKDKKGKPTLVWCDGYEGIRILNKPPKVKVESKETAEDRKRKVLEQNKKRLKALTKEVHDEVLLFVRAVCDDKYGKPKDEKLFIRETWLHMFDHYYSRATLRQAAAIYYGTDMYAVSEEQRDVIRQMPMWKQVLLAMIATSEEAFGNLVQFNNTFDEDNGQTVKGMLTILSQFGFVFTDPEKASVCHGVHELYKKDLPGMPKPETGGDDDD